MVMIITIARCSSEMNQTLQPAHVRSTTDNYPSLWKHDVSDECHLATHCLTKPRRSGRWHAWPWSEYSLSRQDLRRSNLKPIACRFLNKPAAGATLRSCRLSLPISSRPTLVMASQLDNFVLSSFARTCFSSTSRAIPFAIFH